MIGILIVNVHLPFVRSLKEKRKCIHILKNISKDFNAAFSEIENHDKWQIATVVYVVVGNTPSVLDSVLERIADRIDENFEILDMKKNIEPLSFDIL